MASPWPCLPSMFTWALQALDSDYLGISRNVSEYSEAGIVLSRETGAWLRIHTQVDTVSQRDPRWIPDGKSIQTLWSKYIMQYSIVFGTFMHLYIISYHFYISMHICLHTLKFKYARSKVQVTSVVQRVTMCYNVSGPVGTLEAGSILTFHPKLPGHMGSWRARRTDMAWQASNAISAISAISAIAFIMFEYGFMFVWSLNVWQDFVESFARLYPRLKKVLRTSSGTKPCDPPYQGTWQNEYVQFESIWHHFTILDHRGPNFNAGISCRFWTSVKQTHLSLILKLYTEISNMFEPFPPQVSVQEGSWPSRWPHSTSPANICAPHPQNMCLAGPL